MAPILTTTHVAVAIVMVAMVVFAPTAVHATWSIIIVDRVTREAGVAAVTCVTTYDLKELLPVVVVGKGAGCSQSSVDSDASRRQTMQEGLNAGKDPQDILTDLESLPSHQSRQYGLVDVNGGTMTFTGRSCSAWAGGVTGRAGNLTYAIQGNILTGACVVPTVEQVIINGSDTLDIPQLLMDGLQAAKINGGDGRCSCSQASPTNCGCPPRSFSKCGHIGFIISARATDLDDPRCDTNGCARGDYYLDLNVPDQPSSAPDPVDQLQDMFDEWRQENPLRL